MTYIYDAVLTNRPNVLGQDVPLSNDKDNAWLLTSMILGSLWVTRSLTSPLSSLPRLSWLLALLSLLCLLWVSAPLCALGRLSPD